MTEFEPCPNPWCGSTDLELMPLSETDETGCVHCIACGLLGPEEVGETAIIGAWNTRPQPEAEELLELLHERRGSLHCYAASRCVVDYPDSDYVTERTTPLDALRAAREAMKDD